VHWVHLWRSEDGRQSVEIFRKLSARTVEE
jgi:hypothetical protein